MVGLCGPDQGELFSLNETWWAPKPVLSLCFRVTLLVWVPCGLVLLLMLLHAVRLAGSTQRLVILWTKMGIGKIVCLMLGAVIGLVRVGKVVYDLFEERSIYWNQVLSCCFLLVALCSLVCGTLAEHGLGVVSSGPVFLSLLLLFLSGFVELYSSLDDVISRKVYSDFWVSSFVLLYSMVVVSFVLSFFALKAWTSDEDRDACPEEKCSFINKVTFAWFGEKFRLGWKKTLELKDLWKVNKEESSLGAYAHLKKYLDPEYRSIIEHKKFRYYSIPAESEEVVLRQPGSPSLLSVLLRAYGGKIIHSGIFKFMNDLLFFVEPFLLKYFISFASDLNEPVWHGLGITHKLDEQFVKHQVSELSMEWNTNVELSMLVCAVFCVKILKSLFMEQYYYIMLKLGMEVRTGLTAAIYAKSVKLSESGRKESTVGEIVNLMSVDASRMEDVAPVLHEIWSGPFQVGLAMYLLYRTLGPAAFAGAAVFVVMIPLNGVVTYFYDKFQEKQMNEKDERVKLLTEILNGIKILKLYAWEPAFQKKIQKIREKEVGFLKKTSLIGGIFEFFFSCAELIACIVTFGTFVLLSKDHVLTPSTAFVSLYLFEKLQQPLGILPMAITYCAMLAVSIRRLKKFFSAQELNEFDIEYDGFGEEGIRVNGARFSWNEETRAPTLKDVNLSVPRGSLVAVVGSVGAGKSSLLSALSGEMAKMEGSVTISGSVGLIPQEAWIQNMTLRQNVVFSQEFREEDYWRVIDACALRSDLNLLAHGDLTEIGERGINLSGGQKQRVSLARAVYQDSSVYLLDDPLSAVDVHVGKHIFQNVIGPNGLLRKKTRILVTHGLGFLSQCDQIVVMKDGEVSERGSMGELLARKGAFAEFLEEYLEKAPDEEIEELDEEELRQLSSSPNTRAALQKRKSRSRKSESSSLDTNAVLDE